MIHKILLFNLKEREHADTLREKALQLLTAVPGANNVTFRQAIGNGDIRYQYLITWILNH